MKHSEREREREGDLLLTVRNQTSLPLSLSPRLWPVPASLAAFHSLGDGCHDNLRSHPRNEVKPTPSLCRWLAHSSSVLISLCHT